MTDLGIKRLEAIHYYVRDIARSRHFYVDVCDFEELGTSGPELSERGRQKSVIFRAGDCTVVCSEPAGEGGRASRFLKRHPDGVGTLVFEVEDIDRTLALLEERGGTPITDVMRFSDDGGTLGMFSITTPLGDTTFRFVERKGFGALYPGMQLHAAPQGGKNKFGFRRFDHVTSNFQTMKPALLWMEHVLGMQPYWSVQFHTTDVTGPRGEHGSGLRSQVMWDQRSGVKFANNEPWRPAFKASQINLFTEDLRGDGVQHAAIEVPDIIATVRGLRERGLEFMPTPGSYYDALPARLEREKIGALDEDLAVLRELEILVDGDGPRRYLLQIFLKDSAGLYRDPAAGPFFFEIIQRKGDQGFGAGNFRALFEAIEREQAAARI